MASCRLSSPLPNTQHLEPPEAGFILPTVLIIVAVGAIVIIGLLGYTTTVLRAVGKDADALIELYAAEAGVAEVKERLLTGEIIPILWAPESFEVNGLTVEVSVNYPEVAAPKTPRYIDPGVGAVSANQPYRLVLRDVAFNSEMSVNWAFQAEESSIASTIAIHRGDEPDGEVTRIDESIRESPNSLEVADLTSGTYTVEFSVSTSTLVTEPFDETESLNSTWIYGSIYTDYVVTSKAGDTTVTAYLRQVHDPTDPSVHRKVYTLSWKPYE